MKSVDSKITDTIPRASISQILSSLGHIASDGKSNFETVRRCLYSQSGRHSPASTEALWTVARDVLTELQRLCLVTVGPLPRRRSDVDRLRESPCSITPEGKDLAELSVNKVGQAYDMLLLAWLNSHPYFHSLMVRILAGPLYVPNVTSASQVGSSRILAELALHVQRDCLDRFAKVGFPTLKVEAFEKSLAMRFADVSTMLMSSDLDSKKLVDLVQDSVVIPALLEAEELTFDGVTFQHLLRIAGEFLAGASTTSYPNFNGRTVFSTCELTPDPIQNPDAKVEAVQHHGSSFARPLFAESLIKAYTQLMGSSGGYADAYALRAVVCLDLRVQPLVFASCLKDIFLAGESTDLIIYSELPFAPPPQGETYVEVGRQRIGRLKININHGA